MFLYVIGPVAIWFLYRWYKESKRVPNKGDKYVYITGCDTGFGNLLARHLDQLGFRVIAGCYTEKGEDELKKTTSDRLTTVHVDVSDSESVKQAAASIKDLVGEKGLWGVVNNAGVALPSGPNDWFTIEDYKPMLAINLCGVIDVTLSVLPLIKMTRGRVVNVASVFGRISPFGGALHLTLICSAALKSVASLAEMNLLGITVVLVGLVGVWAQHNVLRPLCDSPEAEEAALVAQDYLNSQHTHGYKYALNRIEDIKIYTTADGGSTYLLEVDLLETDCHVLDPTPVANCTVRAKALTAVEGDCDVVLKKVGGALTVTAFKCKTEESTEDLCLGCPTLLPLNDTTALDFVRASLSTFNNMTVNETYTILEVGRMSSQLVAGGPIYTAEYVVVEANCTDDTCVPLDNANAARGICSARGLNALHTVDCKMFATLMPIVDANSTAPAAPAPPLVAHVHTGSLSRKHGLRHHKLTAMHDPHLSGLLSAESQESAEVVPAVPVVVVDAAAAVDPAVPAADPAADPAPAAADASSDASSSAEVPILLMKREAPAADAPAVVDTPVVLVPVCPGRVRFF